MKAKGKELEFISRIKRDGSGTIEMPSALARYIDPEKVSESRHLQEKLFELNRLSISEGTWIASGFNTYVVRFKK